MPNDPAARGGASPQPRGRDHLYVTTRQALPLQGEHVGPRPTLPEQFSQIVCIFLTYSARSHGCRCAQFMRKVGVDGCGWVWMVSR